MSSDEERKLLKRVFGKLEKYTRLTRLERKLGLKDRHLEAWL